MSTSQKHKDFISEPMKDKDVTSIAGIGETYGKKLEEKGFKHAYNLLGQFLLLNKDEDMFTDWLKEEFKFQDRYARAAFGCLTEWCEFNL